MKNEAIKILDYKPEHQPYFEQFNRSWIEKYFKMEPIDKFVLTEPEKAILNRGGAILIAEFDNEIAGAVALKKVDTFTYEFTKMAVAEQFRGKGIGEALARAAIEKAIRLGASKLELYSQTIFIPAVTLYKKLGFKEIPLDDNAYGRCDMKMSMGLTRISVIQAGEEHAEAISTIGKKSFGDAFGPFFNKQEDLKQYLDHTYNTEKIAASIKKPNNVFFLALYNNQVAGFAKIKKQSRNKQIASSKQTELQKIYVLKEYHGTGVAAALLKTAFQFANQLQPDCIWLDVEVNNSKAIRFYKKSGFETYGKHFFTIGSQEFEYHVMVLSLNGAVSNKLNFQMSGYGHH